MCSPDNMLTAHGRRPYSGPRRILVAFSNPLTWDRRLPQQSRVAGEHSSKVVTIPRQRAAAANVDPRSGFEKSTRILRDLNKVCGRAPSTCYPRRAHRLPATVCSGLLFVRRPQDVEYVRFRWVTRRRNTYCWAGPLPESSPEWGSLISGGRVETWKEGSVIKPHRVRRTAVKVAMPGRICRSAGHRLRSTRVDSRVESVPFHGGGLPVWKNILPGEARAALERAHIHYLLLPKTSGESFQEFCERPCGNHSGVHHPPLPGIGKRSRFEAATPLVGILVYGRRSVDGTGIRWKYRRSHLRSSGERTAHYTPVTHPTRPPQATAASLPIACQNRGIISRRPNQMASDRVAVVPCPGRQVNARSPPV